MTATEDKVKSVVQAARAHGDRNIIMLSGVPATGKTYIANLAAEEIAPHEAMITKTQFHSSYAYEDFVQGYRPKKDGGYEPQYGVLMKVNNDALRDNDPEANTYVLIIEEFTRAATTTVLGELMTYIEYRDESFTLPASKEKVKIARNLVLIGTMNPRDRSALELDDALIRRLRIIDCPPDMDQLKEIIGKSFGSDTGKIGSQLEGLFSACEAHNPETYQTEMPFGHAVFAGCQSEEDLRDLWHQQLKYLLKRPLLQPHPLYEVISANYPWK